MVTPYQPNDPELLRLPDAQGCVEFLTEVSFYDLLVHDTDWLNSYVSAKFIRDADDCLEDITYVLSDPGITFRGQILIKVRGNLLDWIAYQVTDVKLNPVSAKS